MGKARNREIFDNSFYILAGEITRALEENKKDGTIQKEQVEELLDSENKFKLHIMKYRASTWVYEAFWQKICLQNKNILSARPYFRESAITFSKKITPAIKVTDIETLKTFNINYQLVKFIKDNWKGKWDDRMEKLYQRVFVARTKLIQNNMPLAVNRAKLFYRKTPKSHLTLIDFIGICAMGLAAGVDKWNGPYSPVFRSVCIGRMVGNLIDSYSETMLHFYPSDKRILYKAHSLRGRRGIDDVTELAEAVKTSFKQDAMEGKSIPKNKIDASELNSLLQAASIVSADATVNDEGFGVYSFTMDEHQNLEQDLIDKQSTGKMLDLAKKLPILHRKVLLLKGLKI
jgi:DNA-directed RNA polymerase specialized sigma subunit